MTCVLYHITEFTRIKNNHEYILLLCVITVLILLPVSQIGSPENSYICTFTTKTRALLIQLVCDFCYFLIAICCQDAKHFRRVSKANVLSTLVKIEFHKSNVVHMAV